MTFSLKVSEIKSPCMGCKNRTDACHISCKQYKEYKAANELISKRVHEKQLDIDR